MQSPDPDETPKRDELSLEELMNQARRASELVDAVDLDKVAAHDAEEIAKVARVTEALGQIEAGESVEHVEGVDDVLPTLDESLQRRADLIQLVDACGLSDRLGRLLTREADEATLKPLELIPHREGLPDFEVCVAPLSANSTGHFGLFVTPSALFAASISEPVAKHHWRIVRSQPYQNDAELTKALAAFSKQAFD